MIAKPPPLPKISTPIEADDKLRMLEELGTELASIRRISATPLSNDEDIEQVYNHIVRILL